MEKKKYKYKYNPNQPSRIDEYSQLKVKNPERYQKTLDYNREYMRDHWPENKELMAQYAKSWRKRPEVMIKRHDAHYKQYGLTYETYQQMVKAQNNLCAICGQPESTIEKRSGQRRRLCVDHNHNTGKTRALLCRACNMALGYLNSIVKLSSAIDYLKKYDNEAVV